MYTFCSHWQYISQNSLKSLNYLSFRYSLFNKPMAFRTLYWAIRLFLSDSAREIFAANNKEFDWITSSVVLEPLSYSAAIPSLAIFAALTWDLTEFKKLLDASRFDQALPTFFSVVFTASSNYNIFLVFRFVFLFIFARLLPPE